MTESFEEYSHFFEVKLDLFDGPIDLLLHLVKLNELPIEKVSLAQVASQYLGCIETMRQFDLDIAGEYLVIAATLLSIKSSVLLNEPVNLVEDEEGNLVNPHDELLKRLREAQVYKDGAAKLGTMDLLGFDVFSKSVSESPVPSEVRYKPHDAILLGIAFRKLLKRADEESRVISISFDPVSIVDRMMGILKILKDQGAPVLFEDLVSEVRSRASIVSCFIAVLELCKRQIIQVSQGENFDQIYVSLASLKVDSLDFVSMNLVSEFDREIPDVAMRGNG